MSGTRLALTGEKEAAEALGEALRALDLEPRVISPESLAKALVRMERELEDERPDGAVAVGTGHAALALAIGAGKLGVPLAVMGAGRDADGADEARILATLASLDAGSDPDRAAGLIASWLREGPAE